MANMGNAAKKNLHAPAQCPVCGEKMQVTGLRCGSCGTELHGSFAPCRFCTLEEKHLQFVEVFLRCRRSLSCARPGQRRSGGRFWPGSPRESWM